MSDVSQGPGWWKASDDKWYPPESHPDAQKEVPPPPPPPPSPPPTQTTSPQSAMTEPLNAPDTGAQVRAEHAHANAIRPWYQKKRFIIPLGFFALLLVIAIASSPKDDSASTTTTQPAQAAEGSAASDAPEPTAGPVPAADKTWQTVTTLEGNSAKRGDIFNLPDSDDIRMRWTSDAPFFSIYIVKKGDSLQEDGGFPETMCTEPCSDETRIANPPGEYYLEANASGGSWSVVIEVLR